MDNNSIENTDNIEIPKHETKMIDGRVCVTPCFVAHSINHFPLHLELPDNRHTIIFYKGRNGAYLSLIVKKDDLVRAVYHEGISTYESSDGPYEANERIGESIGFLEKPQDLKARQREASERVDGVLLKAEFNSKPFDYEEFHSDQESDGSITSNDDGSIDFDL